MFFRNLDSDNDWTFGKGLQGFARTEQAINLNIKTYLQTYLTECFFDQTTGIPWFNACGTKDQNLILIETRKGISQRYGVTEVLDISFTISADRAATISYQIKTIYTKQGQTVSDEVTI